MPIKHISGNLTNMVKVDSANTTYVLHSDSSITMGGAKFGAGMYSFLETAVNNRNFNIYGDIKIATGVGFGVANEKTTSGMDVLIGKSSDISVDAGVAVMVGVKNEHVVNKGDLFGTTGLLTSGDGARIENYGAISGYSAGIEMRGDGSRIENHGIVHTTTRGVDLGYQGGTLINSGKIIATDVAVDALVTDGSDLRIVNTGTIEATNNAINIGSLTGAHAYIRNSGTIIAGDYAIIGNYTMASEKVRNSGSITGSIYLADGNDTYDGRGGTASEVHGGDHDDTYIISDTATKIYEHANEGVDSVKSLISYTLKGDFENLSLWGNAGVTAKGNDASNVLRGNVGSNMIYGYGGEDVLNGGWGNDFLFGGNDADRFVFSKGSGQDVVMDFADGQDVIDLRGISGLESYSDVVAAAKQVGGAMILTFEGGETLTITSYSSNAMSQDDFMF